MIDDVLVDPKRLLWVTVEEPDGTARDVAAIVCAYVVAPNPDGTPAIALEVVTDPEVPCLTEPYQCLAERLVRRVLSPKRVLKVRTMPIRLTDKKF